MQLSEQQQDHVAELSGALTHFEDGGPSIWTRWVPRLREALESQHVLLYEVDIGDAQLELGRGFSSGAAVGDGAFLGELGTMIRTADTRWGIYDPRRPELPQQNQVFAFPDTAAFRAQLEERRSMAARYGVADEESAARAITGFEHLTRFFEGVKLHRHWQVRSLICEGGELLAWLGAFERDPTKAQRAMLQTLVPVVRRRLLLERRLFGGPTCQLALSAALEAMGRPAFVVDRLGRVRHCNRFAQEQLESRGTLTRCALREALAGRSNGHDVVPLQGSGTSPHFLIIQNATEASGRLKLERAARRWGLTPAETRVLALLAAGDSNKEIASALGISPKTVEVHVGRLLAKSGATSRNALSARYWNQP